MRLLLLFLSLLVLSSGTASAAEPTYWQDVRPLLRKHCTVCHSAKNLDEIDVSGGVALDSYDSVRKGAKRPVIVPGKSRDSLLIQLLKSENENERMPKDASALEPEKIAVLARWIDTGAQEGTKPDLVASAAPSPVAKRLRRLDVVLPTNTTPPAGLFGPGKAEKLELALKAGPLAPVTAVTFSPNGKWLAAGSYGQATVWDLAAGKPVKALTNVLGAVNDLRFSPDGKTLAVAGGQPSSRGDLRLYETKDWKLLATLGAHNDVIFSIAFSPDGRQLASASFDKTVRIWDLASRKTAQTFTAHSDFVYSVAFSPDGQWLLSGSKDRSVKKFDAKTGKSLMTFSGMDQDVVAVAVHPNGKTVVSAGLDSNVNWWDPVTGKRNMRKSDHRDAVHELCFSKDGALLASAGADQSVRLWNGSSGAAVKSLAVGSVTYAAAFSPDDKHLATGSFDGLVRIWDVKSGKAVLTLLFLPPREGMPQWLAMTPEGFTAASEEIKSQARWRMGGQVVSGEKVWQSLHQPQMLVKAYLGEKLSPPEFTK